MGNRLIDLCADYGVNVCNASGEFRALGEVLFDLSRRWGKFIEYDCVKNINKRIE